MFWLNVLIFVWLHVVVFVINPYEGLYVGGIFYIIIWNCYIFAFTWPMLQLICIIWLNLLSTYFWLCMLLFFLINYHEELLCTCVCRAHVEASCSELLCRSIIYLCYFFPCFGISLNRYVELLAQIMDYTCFG